MRLVNDCGELGRVQTESDECGERHKITYKVKVKMRSPVMSLREIWITRCGVYRVHCLIAQSWKYSTFQVTSLCHDSEIHSISMAYRWHECCRNLLNGFWITHGAPTTWIYTPRDYLMNTDTASISFPQIWDFHNWHCAKRKIKSAMVNDRKWQAPFLLPLLAYANCGRHGALWHNVTGSGWFN